MGTFVSNGRLQWNIEGIQWFNCHPGAVAALDNTLRGSVGCLDLLLVLLLQTVDTKIPSSALKYLLLGSFQFEKNLVAI
jgi:hypothetical protein